MFRQENFPVELEIKTNEWIAVYRDNHSPIIGKFLGMTDKFLVIDMSDDENINHSYIKI